VRDQIAAGEKTPGIAGGADADETEPAKGKRYGCCCFLFTASSPLRLGPQFFGARKHR
jgi:hypothetical protein